MKFSGRTPISARYLLLIGIAAVSLSAHAMMARHLTSSMTWPVLVLVRALITLALLKVFLLRDPVPWLHRGLWGRSVFGSLFVCLFYWSLSEIPVPDVLAITSTSPFWMALMYWVIFKDRPSPTFLGAAATMLLGVAILDHVTSTSNELGITLAVLAAIATAAGAFSIEYCQGIKSSVITFHLMSALLLLGFIAAVIEGDALPMLSQLDSESWGALIGMSVFALCFQISMVSAAKEGGALSSTFALIIGVVLTSVFDMLAGGFDLRRSAATFLVILPCLLLFLGIIPMPGRAASNESTG